jgi:hypothetical protein
MQCVKKIIMDTIHPVISGLFTPMLVEELTDDAGVEDSLDDQIDELHRRQATIPGHYAVHPCTPLTVHDGPLVGNDRLDEDGVQNPQEEACSVQ